MEVRKRVSGMLIGLALVMGAACSDADVTSSDPIEPGGPSLDGGGWTGSGSRIGPDSTGIAPANIMSDSTGGRHGGWTGSGS